MLHQINKIPPELAVISNKFWRHAHIECNGLYNRYLGSANKMLYLSNTRESIERSKELSNLLCR
jgi:hypothetical protein